MGGVGHFNHNHHTRVDIEWPLGLVHVHPTGIAFLGVLQLISLVCIMAANSFLQYKMTISNRKAAENPRLGNEVMKNLKNLLQEVQNRPRLPSHYS